MINIKLIKTFYDKENVLELFSLEKEVALKYEPRQNMRLYLDTTKETLYVELVEQVVYEGRDQEYGSLIVYTTCYVKLEHSEQIKSKNIENGWELIESDNK